MLELLVGVSEIEKNELSISLIETTDLQEDGLLFILILASPSMPDHDGTLPFHEYHCCLPSVAKF
jgi:hypothetical protein